MSIKITSELINAIFPNNKNAEELAEALNAVLPQYEIDTKNRVAAFLAQCGHESAGFTILKENLNYSAESLCKVWPKRFTSLAAAKPYNRNPEKIANKVYADRMGNGSESSGDGYKFRGRGAIQLTGKDNYSNFAKSIGKTLDETVSYCETLEGAIASACFFWSKNKLNTCADIPDMVALTKKINGGTIGLEDRKHHFSKALSALDGKVSSHNETKSSNVSYTETIKNGSKGELAKKVQKALGISADGIFGAGSVKALKVWQSNNGLTADGIAGPNTLKKLLG